MGGGQTTAWSVGKQVKTPGAEEEPEGVSCDVKPAMTRREAILREGTEHRSLRHLIKKTGKEGKTEEPSICMGSSGGRGMPRGRARPRHEKMVEGTIGNLGDMKRRTPQVRKHPIIRKEETTGWGVGRILKKTRRRGRGMD